VKEAMGDYSDEPPSVRRELDGLHLSLLLTRAKGSPEDQWLANVTGNVNQQVANAMKEYDAQVREGSLTVIGAVYDFRDDFGQGPGRVVIVNINGEKDPQKVAASPMLKVAKARANVQE
jgi:carbonic anhydrase